MTATTDLDAQTGNEAPTSVGSVPETNVKPITPLPWEVAVCDCLMSRGYLDARYIKHAANAYPRLVEALRYYALPGMGDNGDKARVLLRDLGELAPVKPQTEAGDK